VHDRVEAALDRKQKPREPGFPVDRGVYKDCCPPTHLLCRYRVASRGWLHAARLGGGSSSHRLTVAQTRLVPPGSPSSEPVCWDPVPAHRTGQPACHIAPSPFRCRRDRVHIAWRDGGSCPLKRAWRAAYSPPPNPRAPDPACQGLGTPRGGACALPHQTDRPAAPSAVRGRPR